MVTEIELDRIVEYAESVNVLTDGDVSEYVVGEDRFNEICTAYNAMLAGAHRMPAYGVSLDNETRTAVKSGVWAEFVFSKPLSSDGMPFEKLLINVQPEWSGFNIIRYTAKHGYDGRCFYYNLVNGDMRIFYDSLVK
ncbi:MAG: hypothetical protein NC131_00765 [Roseburia sp.]|nr:hypothetical protein [Roseburia sp.]